MRRPGLHLICVLTALLAGAAATAWAQPVALRVESREVPDGSQAFMTWTLRTLAEAPTPVPIQPGTFPVRGPLHAASRLQRGEVDLALVGQAAARRAWRGESPLAAGTEHREMRALLPAFQSALLVLARSTLIGSEDRRRSGFTETSDLRDLQGRLMVFFPVDTNDGAELFVGVLRALEIEVSRIDMTGDGRFLGSHANALVLDAYDAIAFADAVPNRTLEGMLADRHVMPLTFSARQKTQVRGVFPFLEFQDLPRGALGTRMVRAPDGTERAEPLNPATIRTLGEWHFLATHVRLPTCVAYQIVDVVMRAAGLAGTTPVEVVRDNPYVPATARFETASDPVSLTGVRPESFAQIRDIPLHAGAALWLRDNGHPLPTHPAPDLTNETCR